VPQSPVYTLPGGVSSQFVSGLLLASPLTGGVTVRLSSPLASGSYADMTLSYLRAFGARAERSGPAECPVFTVQPPVDLTYPEDLRVGGDWSNAAFFLAAGVSVTGLDKTSVQGDKKILPLLALLRGEDVSSLQNDPLRSKDSASLSPVTIDCSDIPDLVPPLAVMAAAYRKDLALTHVRRLRGKESDRITSVCDMLTALGVKASAGEDSLTVAGSAAPLSGGTADGRDDHRIVMAAALAASFASAPVTILGAEAVNKSYPSFWEDYRKAGGDFRVLS
ncbi:MAG: 3-phosphoshikimate 1-carboxyvinyltransferase, partial [Lachnospiraceae bacterium]|nr:3-phosphoshikimate 1-carboxyvinyltransferase [Lachnospiraceae bacterium]